MENSLQQAGIKNVLIVGGGTAGWMAASLINHHWQDQGIKVTLVESPEIGIIGVGEGSTPTFKDLFDTLGIAESEWMPACNGTYKNGITFKDWSTKPGFSQYFHPFGCTIDAMTYPVFRDHTVLRRKGVDVDVNPDKFFLMSRLAQQQLAPKAPANFPFQFDYAYHFDSVLVGRFLREKAVERGVRHITGTVTEVRQAESGDISAIELADGSTLEADLFVDCTGFAAILLQKTLQVPFISFRENLFNDRAIAIPTPIGERIPSETVSTALRHGWAWQIPLTNRYGNGYVYSADHCSPDEAETELRSHLGLLDDPTEARHLRMRVGRAEQGWVKNCVGIGLSQGFIEPLEATAIQFIQSSIELFIKTFEQGGFSDRFQTQYNDKISQNYAGIRDYIVLHYQTNSRSDTDYWIDNRNNRHISDNLQHIMNCWQQVGNLEAELQRLGVSEYYRPLSWNCLFAGTGQFTDVNPAHTSHPGAIDPDYLERFFTGCLLNFKPHRQQLQPSMMQACA
jgi:flavin-dependent dehydrogenase